MQNTKTSDRVSRVPHGLGALLPHFAFLLHEYYSLMSAECRVQNLVEFDNILTNLRSRTTLAASHSGSTNDWSRTGSKVREAAPVWPLVIESPCSMRHGDLGVGQRVAGPVPPTPRQKQPSHSSRSVIWLLPLTLWPELKYFMGSCVSRSVEYIVCSSLRLNSIVNI